MYDLLIAACMTVGLSVVSLLLEWVTSQVVCSRRRIRRVDGILSQGLSPQDALEEIHRERTSFEEQRRSLLIWGVELGSVAIALDLVALGVWLSGRSPFTFIETIENWIAGGSTVFWLGLVVFHLLLVLLSLVSKYMFVSEPDRALAASPAKLLDRVWLARWRLAANATGFISLLSAVYAFTYSG
jgi:formate-dependent nitrite reductase membrane component NrfD